MSVSHLVFHLNIENRKLTYEPLLYLGVESSIIKINNLFQFLYGRFSP